MSMPNASVVGSLFSLSAWKNDLASHASQWKDFKKELFKIYEQMVSAKAMGESKSEDFVGYKNVYAWKKQSWDLISQNVGNICAYLKQAPGASSGQGSAGPVYKEDKVGGGGGRTKKKTSALIRNPDTGRWVLRRGRIGQQILLKRRAPAIAAKARPKGSTARGRDGRRWVVVKRRRKGVLHSLWIPL